LLGGVNIIVGDSSGNLYFNDLYTCQIKEVLSSSKLVVTIVGVFGSYGYNGENLTGTSAWIDFPTSFWMDISGNLIYADGTYRIRKWTSATRIVQTIAGNGTRGFSNNLPATAGMIQSVGDIVGDTNGNVYFSEPGRIRKITSFGYLVTFLGTGQCCYNGDILLTTSTRVNYPTGVTVDSSGSVYVLDNSRVLKINLNTNLISVVVGNGISGYSGDGGNATSARITAGKIWIDSNNVLYLTQSQFRIRKVAYQIITTFAGTGYFSFAGDGGEAKNAQLSSPQGTWVNSNGIAYVVDQGNCRIRMVNTNGIISSVGGNGVCSSHIDGLLFSATPLSSLNAIWGDPLGNLYLTDSGSVLKVAPNNIITTIAGRGGSSAENIAGTSYSFSSPWGIWGDTMNNLFIVEVGGAKVKILSSTSIIYTIAGTGTIGYSDNLPATGAMIRSPRGVWVDSLGRIFIADSGNNRIRKVENGIMTTYAGNGIRSYNGDGYLATLTSLEDPHSVVGDISGNIYIADNYNYRVRMVSVINSTAMVVTTVIGGIWAPSPPTGWFLATSAPSGFLAHVALDSVGNFYITDYLHSLVRKTVSLTSPTGQPSRQPTGQPSRQPFAHPSGQPTRQPTSQPTAQPTHLPSSQPTRQPFNRPTTQPSRIPTNKPSSKPTGQPSCQPTARPFTFPTGQPSRKPTGQPSRRPLAFPSGQPTHLPTSQPTSYPKGQPTSRLSYLPTCQPTRQPFARPSSQPSRQPTTPSSQPSRSPSGKPSIQPVSHPTSKPTDQPSSQPSSRPFGHPTKQPTGQPSASPSSQPSAQPTMCPSLQPTSRPSIQPSAQPSPQPSCRPSSYPSTQPSMSPTAQPTCFPTCFPSSQPTHSPSNFPSTQPSNKPTARPSSFPTTVPSFQPSNSPTSPPSAFPSKGPTVLPSSMPSIQPTCYPSSQPSNNPSSQPTTIPSVQPAAYPSAQPSPLPSNQPTCFPSSQPSNNPSSQPTTIPSVQPAAYPSAQPSPLPSNQPTCFPSSQPSNKPSNQPSLFPSSQPTGIPYVQPSNIPSSQPTSSPTSLPFSLPTSRPSYQPTCFPSCQPSSNPTSQPTRSPTTQPVALPTSLPSTQPSSFPSVQPVSSPTCQPSSQPTLIPTTQPFAFPTSAPVATIYQTNGILFWLGETYNSNNTNSKAVLGSSYILFGRNFKHQSRFPFSISLSSLSSHEFVSEISKYEGGIRHDVTARSTTIIGDINGDSYLDLLVGYPLASKCSVYLGNGVDDFSTIISTTGESFAIIGDPYDGGGFLGWSSVRIGDLNGDGFDEIVVSAIYTNTVYVIYGKRDFVQNMNVNELTTGDGFKIIGQSDEINFGVSLTLLHDFRKGSRADLAITAQKASAGQNVIYVLFGAVVFKGNEDIKIQLIMNNSSTCLKIITPPFSYAGFSISGIGDINSDGYDDLAVGSVPYSRGKFTEQSTYVVFGRNIDANSINDLQLSTMGPEDGFIITGGGFLVTGVGDVNYDSVNDMMITSYYGWKGESGAYLITSPLNVTYSPSMQPSSQPTARIITDSPSRNITTTTNENFSTFPSVVPTLRPSREPTLRPVSDPTIEPSRLVFAVGTSRPSRGKPSLEPTTTPTSGYHRLRGLPPTILPTMMPTINTTDYTTIICPKSGVYEGNNETNYKFVITANEGTVGIVGNDDGDAKNLYVLYCPTDLVDITIKNFRLSTDIISVAHLTDAGYSYASVNEIAYSAKGGPLTLFFCSENKLQVILTSHSSFQLQEKNFLFISTAIDERQKTNDSKDSVLAQVQIGIAFAVIVFLFFSICVAPSTNQAQKKLFNDDINLEKYDLNNSLSSSLGYSKYGDSESFHSSFFSISASGNENSAFLDDKFSEEERQENGMTSNVVHYYSDYSINELSWNNDNTQFHDDNYHNLINNGDDDDANDSNVTPYDNNNTDYNNTNFYPNYNEFFPFPPSNFVNYNYYSTQFPSASFPELVQFPSTSYSYFQLYNPSYSLTEAPFRDYEDDDALESFNEYSYLNVLNVIIPEVDSETSRVLTDNDISQEERDIK
jgi:hypothetical protein